MRRPKREEISNALGSVLFDANNHPVPHAVLGRDFSKLRNEATKAIEQLLDYAEETTVEMHIEPRVEVRTVPVRTKCPRCGYA